MAVACFSNYVQARKQHGCLRLINCCIGRFYGRCPNPQFLKKLSKLFCFWEDNLALAKFQCQTDTPPNYNLPQLLIKNRQNTRKKQFRIYETAFLSNQVLMFWAFAFLVFTGGGVGVISSATVPPFFFLIM